MKRIIVISIGLLELSIAHAQNRLNDISRVLAAPTARITSAQAPGIRLELCGIYVLDGLLWFVASVHNTTVFDWRATPMRFSIRDRHVWRRRARQDLPLSTIAPIEPLLVPSDSTATFCYALAPRLPTKHQHLVLDYADRTGDRHLTLRLTGKQLLKAKKLDPNANQSVPKNPHHLPKTPPVR